MQANFELIREMTTLGAALWVNPDKALEAKHSILEMTQDLDRAPSLLLDKATREGLSAHREGITDPFYRLMPEERLILAALYHLRWSYERLGKVLNLSVERVAEIAWAARLHLAFSEKSTQDFLVLGVGSQGADCPEVHPARPWAQRFLDEQFQGAEKLYLQTHLERCRSCVHYLHRVRKLYFEVRRAVPGEVLNEINLTPLDTDLEDFKNPTSPHEVGFIKSIFIFLLRPDTQWAIVGGVIGMFLLKIIFKG